MSCRVSRDLNCYPPDPNELGVGAPVWINGLDANGCNWFYPVASLPGGGGPVTPAADCTAIQSYPVGAPSIGPFLGNDCLFHNVAFPTEIFVQSGSYNPATNILTLTLVGGGTVDIDMTSLLSDVTPTPAAVCTALNGFDTATDTSVPVTADVVYVRADGSCGRAPARATCAELSILPTNIGVDTSFALVGTDGAGNCQRFLFVPPSCADDLRVFALSQNIGEIDANFYPVIGQRRVNGPFAGGTFTPDIINPNQLTLLNGSITLGIPGTGCVRAFVTFKNVTTLPVAITGHIDGVPGQVVTLAGTNAFGTAAGESIDLEWDNLAGTYWLH